ncbi:hypothetical protein [Antarctobacter heliothermus]|uniref:Amidohydrolase family protein n=1 Tax=Antarctobacter heliothermus TaxID=74033 RepID=A0A239K4A0_9RHOB|nr:hypothetical protein [Antarctobacter heliothermus]SNT12512.1 hypothetical protein SAMN04488078_106030 [Antarctobacter heliothermus]
MKPALRLLLTSALTFVIPAQALLTDDTIVDVTDGTLTPGQSVLIRNGLIAEVGTDVFSAAAIPRRRSAVQAAMREDDLGIAAT